MKRLLGQHGLTVTRIIYDKTPWGLRGSLQYSLFGDNTNPKHRNRIPAVVDAFIAVDDNSIIAEKIRYNRCLREKNYG